MYAKHLKLFFSDVLKQWTFKDSWRKSQQHHLSQKNSIKENQLLHYIVKVTDIFSSQYSLRKSVSNM